MGNTISKERIEKIDGVKELTRDFFNEAFKSIRKHIEKEPFNSEWLEHEKELRREQALIDEILNLGRETRVLIDPQYWTIKMGFARRLGALRLQAIRELVISFVPLKKIKGYLKEINLQAEETYLSLGCGGFFHDGIAEIPKYVTFNTRNPENFYATFLHEAAGHPIELMIKDVDSKTGKRLVESYQIIREQKAFFGGVFGRTYPTSEAASSFDQFIAEFTKQYCLEGERLRSFIDYLPLEQRLAYQYLYDFLKTVVYGGKEFSAEDLETLLEIAKRIKEVST